MALSGTINKDFGGGYRIQIEWTATQNISANTSTITAKFYLISLGSWHINSTVKKTVRIKIDGTTYTSTDQTAQLASNQKKLMATATKTITHNADGTRSFYIGGSIDIQVTLSGTWYGTVTIPDTQFTLNTIPRASSVSMSSSSVNFGKSVTINISRHSSSFTHRLRYSVAGQSGTIATGVGTSYSWSVPTSLINGISNNDRATCTIYCDTYSGSTNIGTKSTTVTLIIPVSSVSLSASSVNYGSSVTINISRAHSKLTHRIRYNWNNNTGTIASSISYTGYSWTVPNNFMNYIPNSTSTTGTIYVDTYNGTKLVGTKSVSLKTNVPSSVVPSFSSIGHSEQNSAVASLNLGSGVYAQNLSKIKFTINGAAGAYGSTIKSYKIVYDGTTYNSSSATTGTIKNSGTRTVTAAITDSRGRTASKSATVSVLSYNSPLISSFSVRRCNEDGSNNDMGEYMKVTYGGSMSNLNSKNTATVYIDTKPRSSSTWTTKNSFAITGSFSGTKIFGTYEITKSYDVRIRVIDKFYTVTSTQQLSTAVVTMSWGKQGVGIGKVWEQGALDVGGDVYIDGLLDAKLLNAKRDSLRHAGFYATIDFNQLQAGDFGLAQTNSTNGPKTGQFLWVMTQALYPSGHHDGEQPSDMIQIILPFRNNNDFYFRNYYDGTWYSWNKIWHAGNDGAGSGLDADMVDTAHVWRVGSSAGGIPSISSDGVMEVSRYIDFHHSNTDTQDYAARLHTDGTTNGQLFINGHKIWHAGNDGSGSGLDADLLDGKDSSYFQPASDERLKTDIQPITTALEKVLALQGVSFVWNEKAEEIGAKRETLAGQEIGLIAQQVAEVVPEVVLDWIDAPDGETYKTVDTSRMVALLVEAIKELNTKIETIEQQLEGG